jgi:hypothetical protein
MKLKTLTIYAALIGSAFAGLTQQKEGTKIPGDALKLDQENYLTDTNGKADPSRMIVTPVGKLIRIYRTDGFYYTGKVTEIEESDAYFKIYGTIFNVPGAQFGFVLAKGGVFAGAVVEAGKESAYVMEYSPEHKGYVLFKSTKYSKPQA